MPRALSREESKQRTREDLLTAAAKVLRRRGYQRTALTEIAAAAGYTVGAVYSNFEGKEDLLLALVERESLRVAGEIVAAATGSDDVSEQLRRGAAAWIAFLDRDPELYAVFMEFWAVAARSPELRDRNAVLWGSVRTELGNLVERQAESAGRRLVLPAEQVGAAIMALGDGLAIQRLEAPASIPPELLENLLAAMVPALLGKAGNRDLSP